MLKLTLIAVLLLLVESKQYNGISSAKTSLQLTRHRRGEAKPTELVAKIESELADQRAIDEPWEQYLLAGPVVINLLGQVMVISTKRDFSLHHPTNNYQFQYIRRPESFRATLVQIANDGWNAFYKAHGNMQTIRYKIELVPEYIASALKHLAKAPSRRVMARYVPPTISTIIRILNECGAIANASKNHFDTVMALLGEVVESTVLRQGLTDEHYRQTKIGLNISRIKQAEDARVYALFQKYYDEEIVPAERRANQARTAALENIPTGLKKLWMDIGRAIKDGIKVFFNGLAEGAAAALTGGMSAAAKGISGASNAGSADSGSGAKDPATVITNGKSLGMAKEFSEKLGEVTSMARNRTLNEDAKLTFKMGVEEARNVLNIGNTQSKIKTETLDLLGSAIELFNKFKGKDGPQEDDLNDLAAKAKPLVTAELANGGHTPSPESTSDSLTGVAIADGYENEKFVYLAADAHLKRAQQRRDDHFKIIMDNHREMTALIVHIASLDLSRISYEELIKLMGQVIKLLGRVQAEWNNLVLFFNALAVRTNAGLKESLNKFLIPMKAAISKGAEKDTLEERLYHMKMIKEDAVHIQRFSRIILVQSRTYIDVSDSYVMQRLAGLSQLLGASNDAERNRLTAQLERDTRETLTKVKKLVEERKQKYFALVHKRRVEIEQIIESLGGETDDEAKVVDEAKRLLDWT